MLDAGGANALRCRPPISRRRPQKRGLVRRTAGVAGARQVSKFRRSGSSALSQSGHSGAALIAVPIGLLRVKSADFSRDFDGPVIPQQLKELLQPRRRHVYNSARSDPRIALKANRRRSAPQLRLPAGLNPHSAAPAARGFLPRGLSDAGWAVEDLRGRHLKPITGADIWFSAHTFCS
jgi:hypothetical protein